MPWCHWWSVILQFGWPGPLNCYHLLHPSHPRTCHSSWQAVWRAQWDIVFFVSLLVKKRSCKLATILLSFVPPFTFPLLQSAEKQRWYPLCWTVLACIMFSVAASLFSAFNVVTMQLTRWPQTAHCWLHSPWFSKYSIKWQCIIQYIHCPDLIFQESL